MIAIRERAGVTEKAVPLWRTLLFTSLMLLLTAAFFFILEGLTEGLTPWVVIGCPGCSDAAPLYNPADQRWHGAQHGALIAILFAGSMIALTWNATAKPLLMQFYTVGKLVFMVCFLVGGALAGNAQFNSSGLIPFIALILITIVAYPRPRILFDFSFRSLSRPLLVLSALSAAALVFPTVRAISMQLAGVGLPGEVSFFRWGEDATVNIVLLVASLMAATRRPGWKSLTVIVGLTFLYLGAAAITVPHEAASWGYLGGALSLAGGLAYLATAYVDDRKSEA